MRVLAAAKKTIAILFSDIKNFTSIAEEMDPDQLTHLICEYFDELSKIIISNKGTIDKFIGDSIMAFWGAPLSEEKPCFHAAKSALISLHYLEILNAKWQSEGKPKLLTRFGIHIGEAIVGNIGSAERLNYTAVGDAINIASRLENINKIYGTKIIVSEDVYQFIKDQFVLRMLDHVTLKGKAKVSYIYELIAEDVNQIPYDIHAYSTQFSKGFAFYQKTRLE